MRRSEINQLVKDATACFEAHGWTLPPNPRWDVTDFGLGDVDRYGLILVNLAEEPEYCEKLMYAKKGMTTPSHTHAKKKEDIIARWGTFRIQLWKGPEGSSFEVPVNHEPCTVTSGQTLDIPAGQRITLTQGVYHEFYPITDEAIIGEVSTANDDVNDNLFVNDLVGRYAEIVEDEPPLVKLVSD